MINNSLQQQKSTKEQLRQKLRQKIKEKSINRQTKVEQQNQVNNYAKQMGISDGDMEKMKDMVQKHMMKNNKK